MPGYKLDPEALEKAIRELEEIFLSLQGLRVRSNKLSPGELTAGDLTTQSAHKAFEEKATKGRDSFQIETNEIAKILQKKISSYKEVLKEYKEAEENASVDTGKIHREA